MHPDIYVHREGELAFLVLNRPAKRNALTHDMWRRLPQLLAALAEDRTAKVLVLRGADATAFAAGADIDEFEALASDPAAARAYEESYSAGVDALAAFPKPALALIQGHCVGAGCTLAVACDLRFADTTARFAITPAKLGHVYRLEDTRRLAELVGISRAKEMLFTARTVGAAEAKEIGLVQHLCEPAQLESAVLDTARRIAELSQFSVRATKRIAALLSQGTVAETAESAALFRSAVEGEDYLEGVRAFREKRKPKFTFS